MQGRKPRLEKQQDARLPALKTAAGARSQGPKAASGPWKLRPGVRASRTSSAGPLETLTFRTSESRRYIYVVFSC